MFGDKIEINSTNISSVRYDMENRIMEIVFVRNGNVYHFFDIPPELFNDFLRSSSKGRFLRDQIQDKYLHKKIR